ncbi:thioredoxin H-type-like [Durio zibethinus]|uniref:Thioredoxin H-type-like n=1 Tax=Durio zibethinus TaxID=66656 RepID=A0A6P5YUJ7_DURZI|nr:thioredoxin H-type-like [Durio zibethinus]
MGHRWTKFLQFFKCRNLGVKDHQPRSVELAGRNVHYITTIQSWEVKLTESTRDGKILVANFSAPWSAPCRSIAPTYCELADKYPSLIFLTVDVDALAEFSTSWDISATPTFFFLKDGRQVDKFVGADEVELPKKIAAVANLASRF